MSTNIPRLHLIGLIPNKDWIPQAVSQYICEADILAGTGRLLDLFPDYTGTKIKLTLPLDAWLEDLKAKQQSGSKIVLLTSGDPNYYGLAHKLLKVFNPELVTIIPNTTVVQQAFAHLKVSWECTEVVSMHGRTTQCDFWSALYRTGHYSGYLAIYTDPDNSPATIAKRILDRGQQNWRIHVFEDLGTKKEKITSSTLHEAKTREFSTLNLIILECIKKPAPIFLGMSESSFIHEVGLITKREVRMVSLGLLAVQSHHVLWDLGAGSGSISIEAAALLPHGSIWAVEKSPVRAEQIVANRTFFGATQVEIIEDDSQAAINHLPRPDRIFIGGGGQNLGTIIKAAHAKLKEQGVIVVNVVTLDALHQATASMTELGLKVDVTQLQAARSVSLGQSLYLKPLNPVWLIRGASSCS